MPEEGEKKQKQIMGTKIADKLRLDDFRAYINVGSSVKSNFDKAHWACIFVDSHVFLNRKMMAEV